MLVCAADGGGRGIFILADRTLSTVRSRFAWAKRASLRSRRRTGDVCLGGQNIVGCPLTFCAAGDEGDGVRDRE